MDLRDDYLSAVKLVDDDAVIGIITHRGAFKQMKVSEIPQTTRARRGVQVLRELKRNPHRVAAVVLIKPGQEIHVITDHNEIVSIDPADHPLSDRYSNGSFVLDTETQGNVMHAECILKDEPEEDKE